MSGGNVRSYASVISGKSDGGDETKKKHEHGRGTSTRQSSSDRGTSSKQPRSESQGHSRIQHRGEGSHKSEGQSQSTSSRPRGRSASPDSRSSGAYTASEYIRSSRHIPKTQANRKSPSPNGDTEEHYILTLLTTQPLHDYMTSLRKKYFPPHITLFHALPGSKLDQIVQDIEHTCSQQRPFEISTEEPYSPRSNNIMVKATSPKFAIEGIQKQLRNKWNEFLSDQDSGGMRSHWTIMNKVDDKEKAEKSLKEVKEEFEPQTGKVKGLVLWRYDKGYWKDRRAFEFGKRGHGGQGRQEGRSD